MTHGFVSRACAASALFPVCGLRDANVTGFLQRGIAPDPPRSNRSDSSRPMPRRGFAKPRRGSFALRDPVVRCAKNVRYCGNPAAPQTFLLLQTEGPRGPRFVRAPGRPGFSS